MSTTSDGLGWAWQQLAARARAHYPPVCHLCKQPIDLTLDGRKHPLAWTLDHLDPRAAFGKQVPSLDRVRPAHRRCNSSRGRGRLPKSSPRSREW